MGTVHTQILHVSFGQDSAPGLTYMDLLEQVQSGPQGWSMDWEHFSHEEGQREVRLFGREKRRPRGFYQNKEMPEGKWRGRNQAFLSGSQQQEKGKWVQTEIWEALSEDQETLFHCEVDWTLAQVAQGGGRVCILGDILKSHQNMVLRQAALMWPCLSREAGPGATIKWICELSTCSLGGSSIRKGESHLLHTKHMVLLR